MKAINFLPVYDENIIGEYLIRVSWYTWRTVFVTWVTTITLPRFQYQHLITGDRLPLGAPALMISPQPVNLGMVKPELLETRDAKYNISTDALKTSRVEIAEPEWIIPQADYWKLHGKGFAVDVKQTEIKKITPFP